jgi:hypothetical protein
MPNKSRPLFDCHTLIKPQIANSHTNQRSIPARPTRTRNQAMDAEATSPLLPVVQTAAALPVRFPRTHPPLQGSASGQRASKWDLDGEARRQGGCVPARSRDLADRGAGGVR